MFDITSYELGKVAGAGNVVIEGGEDYTFSDPNDDGNVVITKEDSNGE